MKKYRHLHFDAYERSVWQGFANETDQDLKDLYEACEFIFDAANQSIKMIDKYRAEYGSGNRQKDEMATLFYVMGDKAKFKIKKDVTITTFVKIYGYTMIDWLKCKSSDDREAIVLLEVFVFALKALQYDEAVYWYLLFCLHEDFITLEEYLQMKATMHETFMFLALRIKALRDQHCASSDVVLH